jgi:ribosome maturation factor RimP
MDIEAKIEALLEARFREPDLEDCFTVEVLLRAGNRLEVAFDSDSGVSFEKCQKLSRFLEAHLDGEGWLGEKYVLDVSSPGLSRPLKFRRQYPRNIGRTVEVHLQDNSVHKGKLTAADEEQITLEESKMVEVKGKMKKMQVDTIIPFDHIQFTYVKVTF